MVLYWIMVTVSIIWGIFDLCKAKFISAPSIDFKLKYGEINYDDPLQKSVVTQAVKLVTSWAEFALKQVRYSGIYKIALAILLVLLFNYLS